MGRKPRIRSRRPFATLRNISTRRRPRTAQILAMCQENDLAGECRESRTGAEDFIGVGWIAVFGCHLSLDHVVMENESVGLRRCHDAQPLFRAWHLPADGSA